MTQQTQPEIEPPSVGSLVGPYRLLGVAGNPGGLSRLYVAQERSLNTDGRTVALHYWSADSEKKSNFTRSVSASSLLPHLEHPGLVLVHDTLEMDQSFIVAAEYVPGETLDSVLDKCKGVVPPEIAAAIALQLANALHYGHEVAAGVDGPESIVHGDVNPSNVFITYHGTVKLLSVGFAGIRSPIVDAEGNASGNALTFRAPELSEGREVGRHTDVFSVGAILWSCLTGSRSFSAPSSTTSAPMPPEAASSASGLRVTLQAIASRALSSKPSERYRTAFDMSTELGRELLRLNARPTPRHVRRWLQQLFGTERALVHKDIAEGRNVEGALAALSAPQHAAASSGVARLETHPRARHLWRTSQLSSSPLEYSKGRSDMPPNAAISPAHLGERASPTSLGPVPSSVFVSELPGVARDPQARDPKRWILACCLAALVTVGLTLAWARLDPSWLNTAPAETTVTSGTGRLSVDSIPSGALVFIDGEATGLFTPTTLKGLPAGRTLQIRVDKAGFQSQSRKVTVTQDQDNAHEFTLVASDGFLRLTGMPSGASVYVDDVAVAADPGEPFRLSVGSHSIRIETDNELIFSQTVSIVAGDQLIRVDAKGTP